MAVLEISPVESVSKGNRVLAPFFSIGVTTYNRRELLKQTLRSIIGQTFSDFEVVVGNDYVEETLSAELLGVEDPRIRFVNHPQNLGELGNINALLDIARGKYVTWLFDDDLYAPNSLQAVYSALFKFDFPPCVFTSYRNIHGTSIPDLAKSLSWQERLFSGRQFLRMYLSGKLNAMGFAGVYSTEYLRQRGGAERLTDYPIALYSEYMLLFQAGLADKVAYVDAPLVYYRVHEGSWGCSNVEADIYRNAGRNLVQKSIEVLSMPAFCKDFHRNLSAILRLVFYEFVAKVSLRQGFSCIREAIAYFASLRMSLTTLKATDLDRAQFLTLHKGVMWFIVPFIIAKFKATAPSGVVKLARRIHSFFRRRRFFRFR